MTLAPLVLGSNQPRQFYRGGERIARFRGLPSGSAYLPEDWVGSVTQLFGSDGAGLTVLDDGRILRDAIAADPAGYLGPDHVAAAGSDLGLLVKLLDTGRVPPAWRASSPCCAACRRGREAAADRRE
jgi:mannose-6-phosphate isomerase